MDHALTDEGYVMVFLHGSGLDDGVYVIQHGFQMKGFLQKLQLPLLDSGHIQYLINQGQQMAAGDADFFQAVPYPLRLVCVGCCKCRHPYDCVHGRAYVMGHPGQEITFGLVGHGG